MMAARSDGVGSKRLAGIRHSLLERTDDGAGVSLQIESREGMTAILCFRAAALPEQVDGVVQ